MTSLFHAGCQWRGVAEVRALACPASQMNPFKFTLSFNDLLF
jgi:hypothetical protein